jgi:tRNA(adenine34) deaminase
MDRDEIFMKAALAEAIKASRKDEVPVGAVVVSAGRIIARGRNRMIGATDPTAHAEVVAIRRAARRTGNYRLAGCDLYVTIEPCAMCLGAAIQARIRRIVYGAPDPKAGAVESALVFPFDKVNHRIEVRGGILAPACGRALKEFFKAKRHRPGRSSS